MAMLSDRAYARARDFVAAHARPLDRALLAHQLDGASGAQAQVAHALGAYQNEDGGLGRALEPDFRLKASSVIATTVGLQYAVAAGLEGTDPVVRGALAFLVRAWDPESGRWPAVPAAVNGAPHAPWWAVDAESGRSGVEGTWANPSAEVVAYLWRYPETVPEALRERATERALAELGALAGPLDLHDFLCYARLAEALPAGPRAAVMEHLTHDLPQTVAVDPASWRSYGAKPLTLAPTPDAAFAPTLRDALERNLDFEIESQAPDGSWRPSWSWADAYPEAWSVAAVEWAGALTVGMLRSLKAFGRIA
jgi:hypothetical protein